MKRGAGLTCLLLGALAGAAAWAAPAPDKHEGRNQPGGFEFAVIGHAFPGDSGDEDLQRTLALAEKEQPSFVVAAGIKSAGEPCSDKLYLQRRALLQQSARPLLLVLAGSDWTECRNSAGRSNAIERLNRIREIYFDSQDALGGVKGKGTSLDVSRQSTIRKFRSYAENAHWEQDGVLFATLNLPAHNNHFLSEAGRNSEYEDRLVANRAWLQRLFGLAKRRKLEGLVLFSDGDVRVHAEPGFSLPAVFSAKQDGFAETRRLVRTLAEKYQGRVLLVDTNTERDPKAAEAPDTVTWRGNMGHVTLAGEWNVVRVTPGGKTLFALQPAATRAHEKKLPQQPGAANGQPQQPNGGKGQAKLPKNDNGQPKPPAR